jgi:F-type H+-transporting ATPase subunit epsilon
MSTLPTFLGVNVVTPKGVIAHTDTDSLQAPGELGEFELLPGHVPLLTALRPGVLTIGSAGRSSSGPSPGGPRTRYAIASGYLRVDPSGSVEILVEQATLAKDIDTEAAKKDLAAGEAELAKWDKAADGDFVTLQHKVGWAKARLDASAAPH